VVKSTSVGRQKSNCINSCQTENQQRDRYKKTKKMLFLQKKIFGTRYRFVKPSAEDAQIKKLKNGTLQQRIFSLKSFCLFN
jgi:hypothetical protein